jgi:hypothetical protein
MVKFLTFFVGLIVGVQHAEVMVSDPATAVEIRVNGSPVAKAEQGPWQFRFDLGSEIRPIKLEAVAFDAAGQEVDRDVRWINLPENRAEAEIVPEINPSGEVVAATLTWQSAEFRKPKDIRARLDGRAVQVRPPYRIDLSAAPRDRMHVLDVEFQFTAELCLKRQLTFGAGFAGDHTSGLTAVPLHLDDVDELPPVDQMSGWLTASGRPARITDSENGPGRLVVVRDPGAEAMLSELLRERKRQAKRDRRRGAAKTLDLLDESVEIRVLVPEPVPVDGRSRATFLFPYSDEGSPGDEGILKAAAAPRNERMLGAGLMLPDGVAMAGIHASEGGRRRAVLLILGPEREDIARLEPADVRSFLDKLRVPLVVWDLSGPREQASPRWPADHEIRTFDDLARATRRLHYLLQSQRIVWATGRHLPQDMALGPDARGVSLVR